MGKRNKKSSHSADDCKKPKLHEDYTTIQEENIVKIKVKKSKVKTNKTLDPVEVVETKSRKNKKPHKNVIVDNTSQTDDLDVKAQEKNVENKVKKYKDRTKEVLDSDKVVETKSRKGKKKPHKNELAVVEHKDENVMKSKKIIFIDDVAQQVASNSGQTIVTSNKKTQNEQNVLKDEDIKDEDIDEFCDELSSDDNVQYENWVKLIEAKLH